MNVMPVVAITGSTGLVGSNAARHLAASGYRVIAVARNQDKAERVLSGMGPERQNIETRLADLGNREDLKSAFQGSDVVLHAAGSVDPYGSRQAIFAINVAGAANAMNAAVAVGARQFIHISSLSVITGQGDRFDVDESEPLKPCGEAYADSKIEAERLLTQLAAEQAIKLTCLRPGFIYGPGEQAWMPRLINSIATGKAMLIDGGLKETNVIYVGNLSRAIAAAILNERAFGQVYNLTDGQKISKKRLFDAIADGLGLPRVQKKIPGVVARTACEIISTLAPALPKDTQVKLARYSRAAFRLAGVNQGFSITKAERELAYVDRFPFDEGMAETLAAFNAARSSSLPFESPASRGVRGVR